MAHKPKRKPKNDTSNRPYIIGLVGVMVMGLGTMWALSWLLAPAATDNPPSPSAEAAAAQGQYLRAAELYTEAIESSGGDDLFAQYIGRASAYYNIGDYSAALADYDTAAQLDATHADSYAGRARVYEAQGDFQRAADALKQAIERRSTPQAADFRLLGRLYDALEQPDTALEQYQRYLELAPQPDATIQARVTR